MLCTEHNWPIPVVDKTVIKLCAEQIQFAQPAFEFSMVFKYNLFKIKLAEIFHYFFNLIEPELVL